MNLKLHGGGIDMNLITDKNKGKLSKFLAGKGFYVTLFLCIAAIGVSSYILFFAGAEKDDASSLYDSFLIDSQPFSTAHDADDFLVDLPAMTAMSTSPAFDNETSAPVMATAKPQVKPTEATETVSIDKVPTKPSSPAKAVFVWPVNGKISRDFSIDELKFDKTMGDWRVHKGIDIETSAGAKVYSVSDGEVSDVYTDDLLGTTVVIRHSDGYTSVYSNLMGKPVVSKGQKVLVGGEIGGVGDSAQSETGEVIHLHFELLKDGVHINPANVLPK